MQLLAHLPAGPRLRVKPGHHADALRRDRARRHHKTEYFLRLRPLAERGSLAGTTPLAPVLSQVAIHDQNGRTR